MARFVTFKIYLTDTILKISIINESGKEQIIKLNQEKDKYPISIKFDRNEIEVCQEEIVNGENSFNGFLKELFVNPTDYKRYSFDYQNRNYNVLSETLFVLIVNSFKQQIDKIAIINNIEIDLDGNDNKELIHRM